MKLIDQQSTGEGGIVCTECGVDVRQISRGRHPRWSWLWVLPKLAVMLVVFATVVWCLPWVQGALGNGMLTQSSTIGGVYPGIVTADPAFTLSDAQRMLDGNMEMRAKLVDAIHRRWKPYPMHMWEASIRFVGVEKHGYSQQVWDYGLFIDGYRSYSNSVLSNLSELESWDPLAAPVVEEGMSLWPWGYSDLVLEHDGAYQRSETLDYIDVLIVIGGIWLVVWLSVHGALRVIARVKTNADRTKMRTGRMTLIGVVIVGGVYLVGSLMFPAETNYLLSIGNTKQSSEWIEYGQLIEELERNQQDPSLDGAVWDAIETAVNVNGGEDLLLGMQVDYGHMTDMTHWWVSFHPVMGICTGSSRSYWNTDEDGLRVNMELPESIDRGMGLHMSTWQRIVFSWTDGSSMREVTFEPMAVLFLLACVVWWWKLTHWAVGKWSKRLDRRRVKRELCVECGYPLSEVGVGARSLVEGT